MRGCPCIHAVTRLDWLSGYWIDAIQFSYAGVGARHGTPNGAVGGIALNAGERITSVIVTTNNGPLAVARLEFGTSVRTIVAGSGQPLNDPPNYTKWPILNPDKPAGCPSTSEKRLIAIRGTSDGSLRSISFVWAWPDTCTIRGNMNYGAPGSQFMTMAGAPNAAACCTACGNNALCAYWVWSSITRDCMLMKDQGATAYVAFLGHASGPKPPSTCVDKVSSCASWQTFGYCKPGTMFNNQSVPTVLCPKTCGICGVLGYEILDMHNYYRARHHAPAMAWSTSLEASARAWGEELASYCGFEHSGTNGVGENLAAGQANWQQAADGWYNEIYEYDYNNPGFSSGTGHATQLLWVGSTQLGCAAVAASCTYAPIYVCQYYPPGNMAGDYESNVLPP
ncbi:hypothetical protein HYH03_001632 [Edaphochlamys debaryana]|uniref:ShKT domain-containing protein n=1 Tax=Edaphochlamys debaryana TaxID=47281 RepID=A0A835YH60_9CHLO|nr:hypothetical protein HYH03_001632 [Edaphochlamys debaryana]|eukprot:KAG2500871.1 hypothetical protein HYH03_001632 [Edaphochlamys debaryana]